MNLTKIILIFTAMTFSALASAIDNSKACVLDQYNQTIDALYSDKDDLPSLNNMDFQMFLTFEYRCQLSKGRTESEIFQKLDEHIDQFNKKFISFTSDNKIVSKQQMHIFTSKSVNDIVRKVSPNMEKTCGDPEYRELGLKMRIFAKEMPSRESFERYLELDIKCVLDAGLTADEIETRLSNWAYHYNELLRAHNAKSNLFSPERFVFFAVGLLPALVPQANQFFNPAHQQLINKFSTK